MHIFFNMTSKYFKVNISREIFRIIYSGNSLLIIMCKFRQATKYAQDTVLDADGVHQGVAKNVTDEGARTIIGGFGTETETDEDV